MKMFAGNKPLDVIKQQCKDQGIVFDDERWRVYGDDYVRISGGGCWVLYNTFNGSFFGETPDGTDFSNDSDEHEDQPWFQALLSFFYVEQAAQ